MRALVPARAEGGSMAISHGPDHAWSQPRGGSPLGETHAPAKRDAAPPFAVTRLGAIMRRAPGDPHEAWGVLNPGCVRGRDGELYLFPQVVAEGNYSRIGRARVRFDGQGNPMDVERLGTALEPTERYERAARWRGGVEDARVTYVPALDRYVMVYTACGLLGDRIAVAMSSDLRTWERVGLAHFAPERGIDWNAHADGDGTIFPEPVAAPDGRPAVALIHRPRFLVHHADGTVKRVLPEGVRDPRGSLWISYIDLEAARHDNSALRRFGQHQPLAAPEATWERVRLGALAPPLLTHLGWLLVYTGVGGEAHRVTARDPAQKRLVASAGVMVLDRVDPRRMLYRSPEPILEPLTREEREGGPGAFRNLVVPAGLDPRSPPAPGARVDLYYGMAESAGVGWLTLPTALPDALRGAAARDGAGSQAAL